MTFIEAIAKLGDKTSLIRRDSWAEGDYINSDFKMVNIYGKDPTEEFNGADVNNVEATDWDYTSYRDTTGTFVIDEDGNLTIGDTVYDFDIDEIDSIIDVLQTYTNILFYKDIEETKENVRKAFDDNE